MCETIELLNTDLLKQYPGAVREIDYMRRILGKQIGWHYILDITYIVEYLSQMGLKRGATILDAGASVGLLQFVLANRGYNIVSVDFSNRTIPLLESLIFSIKDMGGKHFKHPYLEHLELLKKNNRKTLLFQRILNRLSLMNIALLALPFMWIAKITGIRQPGLIKFYREDMRKMDKIKNVSIDAVVSVSAIEHMEKETVKQAIEEFKRILKPGGKMVITTSAAKEKDWFHTPSMGWCFSESTLKSIFGFSGKINSNWSKYDEIMREFHKSTELQQRIPPINRNSGNNGMPWGKWDPKYLPVGIIKKIKK